MLHPTVAPVCSSRGCITVSSSIPIGQFEAKAGKLEAVSENTLVGDVCWCGDATIGLGSESGD